jgi:uncharacterized membrane protein YeaQ/YmgE (transglycosylase-associated protein family)
MNLLVILLAGAALGAVAGLVFRTGGVLLHAALGAVGAVLAGALDSEGLLTGLSPVSLGAAALGALALVVGAHVVGRIGDGPVRGWGRSRGLPD